MQDHNPPPSPAEQAAPELVENVTTPASAEAPVAEERVGDTLPSLIHQLRRVLDKPFPTPLLHTMHGIGYRLSAQ